MGIPDHNSSSNDRSTAEDRDGLWPSGLLRGRMALLQRPDEPRGMVPIRQYRGGLLPWEKQLIDALGLTIEEYKWYANQVANHRPERSAEYDIVPHVQCTGFETFLVTTIVGAGLSFAASALAPKPKLPKRADPGQAQTPDVTGASVAGENRFVSVDGFTSVQPLARLGDVIPLVFANQETIGTTTYGGVRVDTKLLWSQLLSMGDGQELLTILLAGNGVMPAASALSIEGFAVGDTLLRGYETNKFAIYYKRGVSGEGRLIESNKIAGELKPRYPDVFLAELGGATPKPIFSGVRIPTTLSVFGIYEPLRNGQDYRLPYKRVRVSYPPQPGRSAEELQAWEREQRSAIRADIERSKTESHFSCKTGIQSVNGITTNDPSGFRDMLGIQPGSLIVFAIYGSGTSNNFDSFGVNDIIAKDDNYRRTADDVLVIGENYFIGGVETTCIGSSPETATWSEGTHKSYTFKVIRRGNMRIVSDFAATHSPDFRGFNLTGRVNPTTGPSICRVATGHITTARKLNQIEIGIKSQVWKRFSGFTNFASLPDEGTLVELEKGGGSFNIGTYSEYGLRYSFFRIQVRERGTEEYHDLEPQNGALFAVKGRTPVDQYNFVRIKFPRNDIEYEVRCRPVPGNVFITYTRFTGAQTCILDARSGGLQTHTSTVARFGTFTVSYKGYREEITSSKATNPVMISPQGILEEFDAAADIYMYDGQEGSHQNGPEHQIVYVNEQRENINSSNVVFSPQYDNLALLGVQMRNGKEWNDFNNFSYYAKQGCEIIQMVNPTTGSSAGYSSSSTAKSPSHLFPEILRHLLRAPLTGANKLVPEEMIDWPGFQEACKVCIANKWFWDGVLSNSVNIRQWASENASYFFLDFLVTGGKISLQPTFPVDASKPFPEGYTLTGAYNRLPRISALFTDGNIIEDSLQVSWYPAEQRIAPQVVVTIRDEVPNGFAETRSIHVRLSSAEDANALSAPLEAVDFTGFCTSTEHAIQFAKLLIQTRRYVSHTITFKTFPDGLALAPGAYFKLASQARHVDRFENGYVLDDGKVISSAELSGTNQVYWWRPGMTEVLSESMTVTNGVVTNNKFAGAVFTVYSVANNARVYKAEAVSYDEEGMVEITGSHVFVTDAGNIVYLDLSDNLFVVENNR